MRRTDLRALTDPPTPAHAPPYHSPVLPRHQAREHIVTLTGVWSAKQGGLVELYLPPAAATEDGGPLGFASVGSGGGSGVSPDGGSGGGGESPGGGSRRVVFRAVQSSSALSLTYSHPLSAYQVSTVVKTRRNEYPHHKHPHHSHTRKPRACPPIRPPWRCAPHFYTATLLYYTILPSSRRGMHRTAKPPHY